MLFSAQKLQDITNFLSHEMENIIDVGIFLEKDKICENEEDLLLSSDAFWASPSSLPPSKSFQGGVPRTK